MIKNRFGFLLSLKSVRFTLIGLILISSGVFAGESEADLQSRLSKLERMVDNRGLLNILNEMESLQKEVRDLRGEVEQQAYIIDQMKKRQQNLYDDLDQRLQTGQGEQTGSVVAIEEDQKLDQPTQKTEPLPVEQNDLLTDLPEDTQATRNPENLPGNKPENSSSIQPVETYVAKQKTENNSETTGSNSQSDNVPSGGTSEQAMEMPAGSSEENSYSEAFTLLKQGQHDKAEDNFRAFLQQYPSSQYADNAQYWLGESYYAKRKFETAITEYKELLNRYPDSGKASHAQLKIGYCYDELGQTDFAQGELEDLVARYPGTSAANLAEERLALIRSQ